jgi:hypothetical protein
VRHNSVDEDVRYVLTEKGRRDLADFEAAEAQLYDLCHHRWFVQRAMFRGIVAPILKCQGCGDVKRLGRGTFNAAVPK